MTPTESEPAGTTRRRRVSEPSAAAAVPDHNPVLANSSWSVRLRPIVTSTVRASRASFTPWQLVHSQWPPGANDLDNAAVKLAAIKKTPRAVLGVVLATSITLVTQLQPLTWEPE